MRHDGGGNLSAKPDEVLFCENIRRGLVAGKCDTNDYFFNINIWIIGGPESTWPACLDTVPEGLEPRYLEYLRREVVACDYMPYPAGFLFGDDDLEFIEQVKREKRPKYIALVALVERRLA